MYLARFSYDVLPANRQRAIDLIRQEVEAAREEGRNARLLVPLTRGQGGVKRHQEPDRGRHREPGHPRHAGASAGAGTVLALSSPERRFSRNR